MSKALYRKYRPTKLGELVGEESITNSLSQAIDQNKFSHAYLFTGPRGTGKTSTARIFAHEINHFDYQIEDDYVDIIEIDAASNTGVDNIRDLREKAIIAPSQGKYKVYIIDEVHMLSKSAFNALLKILEEPPEHVIFIMATTDAHKVPITITSRAQVFNFQLANPDVMTKHLTDITKKEHISITSDALSIIVRRGGGSFRDSLSLLDQISTLSDKKITAKMVTDALGLPQDEIITNLLDAYKNADVETISSLLKTNFNSGIKPETLLEELIKYIIEHSESTFISLLARLSDIKPPFIEAKLLIALLSNVSAPATPLKNITQKKPDIQNSKPLVTPSTTTTTTATASTNFNWDTFVQKVQQADSSMGSMLRNFNYQIEKDILYLISPNIINQKILNKTEKKKLLSELSGFAVSIELPNFQKTVEKSPTLATISAIMGDVQEVVNGGESPF